MATVHFEPEESGCVCYYLWDGDYATIHDADSGIVLSSRPQIGQKYQVSNPYYWCYRGFLSFDTSDLDDNTLIESATLRLYTQANDSDTEFQIIIKNGMPTYPHIPLEAGDYDLSHYSGNGGIVDTDGMGATVYFYFNYIGLSWINKTGSTKFALISSRDFASNPPTGNEHVTFKGKDDTGYKPRLTIVYFISTGIPVVGDPTFSNTKANYTTVTANVSDAGGGYSERGFEYGTSEEPMWAVREIGIWGSTGNYSLQISGLVPETTYYVRAYVTNSFGTGYSEWTSFTTIASPSYGITEEENSKLDSDGIYANSNTICFYVRRVGGKWSIKHGPYTSDQIDIEITKILTEGKGKYQIKFTSDVLTGLSASIMTKLDIKAR